MDVAEVHGMGMLILIVFALGAKHGMDPDHIATIDGLVRFNAQRQPQLARWSGCLFSLGHGFVVTIVAALVASFSGVFSAPAWLEHVGAWVSIIFLMALGIGNIAAVWRAPRDQVVRSVGLRARWLGRFAETDHPMVIASVGAAFALSFDTWSQAALFSLTAQQMAGWTFSVLLGLVFTAGMMAADGINGLWMARLIGKADRRALIASRVMSLAIGVLGIAIASLGVARYFVPDIGEIMDAASLYVGLGIMALLMGSFAVAMRITARPDALR